MSDLQALVRLARAAPVAVGAAVAAALLAAAGIVVELDGSVSIPPADRLFEIALGLACATCAALGALIVAAIPRQRVGIALVAGGTLGALVGLRSMRERAAELGGQIVLSQASQGGLAVAVRLPNASQPAA
jgi:hypothetical protein